MLQVLFSDEKWWVVKMKVNKQNDRFWAPINPHRYIENKEQNPIKVRFLPLNGGAAKLHNCEEYRVGLGFAICQHALGPSTNDVR